MLTLKAITAEHERAHATGRERIELDKINTGDLRASAFRWEARSDVFAPTLGYRSHI
ncbi:MAG: hypothetical protein NVV63_18440 [Opitutus sp.]|nr:hypothetical protein [Opitutus sp.]